MAISDSPTTCDASVLARILAALNVLPVLTNEVRLAEFTTELLQEIPGVAATGCCIRGLPEPTGHFKGTPCGQCRVRQLAPEPDEPACELAIQDDLKALPIATWETFCGFLLVSTANATKYQPYEPFLTNLANSIAFALENQWQRTELLELNTALRESEEQLREAHAHLEEKVQERTADLSRAYSELKEEMAERKRLQHEILRVTEWEQRRIGQDLHDGLGQQLAGVAIESELLAQTLAEQNCDETAATAAKVARLVREAISQTRHLVRGLLSEYLEVCGLTKALEELASGVADSFPIRCLFQCESPGILADNRTAIHLYRIAQEAVHNAAKHGKAKNITLTLAQDRDRITLTVEDDGTGFSTSSEEHSGMGLRIMNYRARIINGVCEIQSAPGEGTIVICSCRPKQSQYDGSE